MHPMQVLHSMSSTTDAPTGIDSRTVKRVWAFSHPYRGMVAGFMVLIIAGTIIALIPTLAFRDIIDTAITDQDTTRLNWLGLLVVVAAFAAAAISMIERWLSSRIGEGIIYDLRDRLFRHVQNMPLGFFTQTQTGALISRLNNDVIGAQRAFTTFLSTVIGNVINLIITLFTMFYIEWRLTLLSLIILPFFIIPSRRVGARMADITRESMELNASMNTTMTERFNVSGALLVKLFGRPAAEADDFATRAARVRDIGIRSALYARTFMVAMTLVGALGTAAIYWIGGRLVIEGSLTVGDLAALSLLVVRVYLPLTALTNARVDVTSALVSFERVFEIIDMENPIRDRPGAVELADVHGDVRFDNVGFTYPAASSYTLASLEDSGQRRLPNRGPGSRISAGLTPLEHAPAGGNGDERPVLHGVDLHIEAGQLVAIVGPSGAGKSTITNLVPRLYEVNEGAILIDGHDIRDVTQSSLRHAIGVVNQDPHMFHDTVATNLRYAAPDATMQQLIDAAKAARIHDVIHALPEGYDTVVGERGYRLSGGEKQRLAIARMLLKDPAIVILDEATSHLDTENEALIQAALEEALSGRTSLVIAHRLSTITAADQIIVLEEGRVVERGRHDELRTLGGLYNSLYENLLRVDVTSAG
ncbi:MAG: ABC transporter ATP-binding protein [Acidimicrobiia bacterium]|nr:ABC transporter ATP-binding protein [Acidimicrobiia bacterium]